MDESWKVDHAKNIAIQLLRAKFGGRIPETVTAEECLELMLELSKFETRRADDALELIAKMPIHQPFVTR